MSYPRRVVHFEVSPNATQNWLSRQMIEAFPWDTAPRYLLRDRDKSYGPAFRHRVRAMGITEVITAPRSPWQNPYAKRLIGSIRRRCLASATCGASCRAIFNIIMMPERICRSTRTARGLVQLPSAGNIVACPEVGGLHHRYERRAA
jgi:hypothetical protein